MDLITHPSRTLICGRSRMGKTTLAVKIVNEQLKPSLDRIILVSQSSHQDTFDPIRRFILKKDIHGQPNKDTFKNIFNNIAQLVVIAEKNGLPPQRTLILVDDLAGTGLMHNNRKGAFANLSVQTPHWSVSLIVISHRPTNTDPDFRNNAENIIIFPPDGEEEYLWLKRCYQSLAMENKSLLQIVTYAFKGGRKDSSEWGKHFLFIYAEPRSHSRFFVDFDREIQIN